MDQPLPDGVGTPSQGRCWEEVRVGPALKPFFVKAGMMPLIYCFLFCDVFIMIW